MSGVGAARSEAPVARVCHISSVAINIQMFFRGQFQYLVDHGLHYTVVCSEPTREGLYLPDAVTYVSLPITRAISPLTDLRSLWRLYRLFRRERFDLVQYTTPKGALLGSIAAFLARVPARLYLLWGIYYMGQSGPKRAAFRALEKLCCALSTHVNFDGFAIRDAAVRDGLVEPARTSVIGQGSDNGIDLSRFDPVASAAAGREIRQRYGIPADAVVVGCVARICGDKGVHELIEAYARLAERHPQLYVLWVGPAEPKDQPAPQVQQRMDADPRIVLPGLQHDIQPFYAAMDIFCLPTYREGFSAVNLEAAAMGLPVVTTDAVGAGDTIEHGRTGLAVPVADATALATALEQLITQPELRRRMGAAGRQRVAEHFEQSRFWKLLLEHRQRLLVQSGRFRLADDGRLERV